MKVSIPPNKFNQLWKLNEPVMTPIITTRSKDGIVNAAIVSWFSFLSRSPPLVFISIRSDAAGKRHTYDLIRDTKEFVVNIPGFDIAEAAFVTAVDYSWEEEAQANKLVRAGLTEISAEKVKAPRIKECKIHYECVLEFEKEFGDHTVFIGKVVAASATEGSFDENYWPNVNVIQPVLRCGGGKVTYKSKISSGDQYTIVDYSKGLSLKRISIPESKPVKAGAASK
jgi:flavin reductase (DIM6/NTAB) family NADH-FMN oxidoreductase RutF